MAGAQGSKLLSTFSSSNKSPESPGASSRGHAGSRHRAHDPDFDWTDPEEDPIYQDTVRPAAPSAEMVQARSKAMDAYQSQARHLNLMLQEDALFVELPGRDDESRSVFEQHPIPLFKHEATGWHYCLRTRIISVGPPMVIRPSTGMGMDWVYRLIGSNCHDSVPASHRPESGSGNDNGSNGMRQCKTDIGIGVGAEENLKESHPLPKLVAPLGPLVLVSPATSTTSADGLQSGGHGWFETTSRPTGYILALDILHKDLPLWILREDLGLVRESLAIEEEDREPEDWWDWVAAAEPFLDECDPGDLFDGELLVRHAGGARGLGLDAVPAEAEGGRTADAGAGAIAQNPSYDAACIMSSYRQLGQPGASFKRAVDLIQKTRRSMRPRLDQVSSSEVEGKVWDFDPDVEYRLDYGSGLFVELESKLMR